MAWVLPLHYFHARCRLFLFYEITEVGSTVLFHLVGWGEGESYHAIYLIMSLRPLSIVRPPTYLSIHSIQSNPFHHLSNLHPPPLTHTNTHTRTHSIQSYPSSALTQCVSPDSENPSSSSSSSPLPPLPSRSSSCPDVMCKSPAAAAENRRFTLAAQRAKVVLSVSLLALHTSTPKQRRNIISQEHHQSTTISISIHSFLSRTRSHVMFACWLQNKFLLANYTDYLTN